MKRKPHKPHEGVESLYRVFVDGRPRAVADLQDARYSAALSRHVFEMREAACLTQRGLAELVGTTPSVISRLEDDDYEGHSLSMLKRIASALGMCLEIRFVPAPKDPRERPRVVRRRSVTPRRKKRVG